MSRKLWGGMGESFVVGWPPLVLGEARTLQAASFTPPVTA